MSISITLPDGSVRSLQPGAPLQSAFINHDNGTQPVLAAELANRYVSLHEPVWADSRCVPITYGNPEGQRVYIRSLSMLAIRAAHVTHPEKDLIIDFSLGRSLFCHWADDHPFTAEDISRLVDAMHHLVDSNLPIYHRRVPLDEARAIFLAAGQQDKALLLRYACSDSEDVYELDGLVDGFFGPLVPFTGLIKDFNVLSYPPGFLISYPVTDDPSHDETLVNHSKLFETIQENEEWGRILRVANLGQLNELIAKHQIGDIIKVAEALHERRLACIADYITTRHARPRFILVAGPSSSGKTTFAYRLAIHLRVLGLSARVVSLDDYYRPRASVPVGSDGKQNFEDISALDIELLGTHLNQLATGVPTQLPRYNFTSGEREWRDEITLGENDFLIIEGIHGLNPALVPSIPRSLVFRVFVSALTQLNFDNHNRVSTTDLRTIRRIVRDAQFRGWDAAETLARMPDVVAGENRNIFPYQEMADMFFNSALIYELAGLSPFAEPMLAEVQPDTPQRAEATRLLTLLNHVLPTPVLEVPPTSILREYIGGSSFVY